MKYNISRDLAVYKLQNPLSKKGFHGLSFNLTEPEEGQIVDIYSYSFNSDNHHRSLVKYQGHYVTKTSTGLLGFKYNGNVRPGESGGIVIDSKSRKILGILTAVATNIDNAVVAVPVKSLSDFLSKVQPYLCNQLFPSVIDIPISLPTNFYPDFTPSTQDSLQSRTEESEEIKSLRVKSQILADNMNDFITIQSFEWGINGKSLAASQYEIQVIDGAQKFRDFPDGTKLLDRAAFPFKLSMVPGSEWSVFPQLIGTNLKLKLHKSNDIHYKGQDVRVFQYYADTEDKVCAWGFIMDYGFFVHKKVTYVSCYGEVWTDKDLNILRISTHYPNLTDGWKDFLAVMTYDWLKLPNKEQRLVPVAMSAQAMHKDSIFWSKSLFTGYRVFSSDVVIGSK
jgi:hypothetical protein